MYAFFRLLYLGSFAKSALVAVGAATVPWAAALATLPWDQARLVYWGAAALVFAVLGYRSWQFRREIVDNVKPAADFAKALSSGDADEKRKATLELVAAIAADEGEDDEETYEEEAPDSEASRRARAETRERVARIVALLAEAGIPAADDHVKAFLDEHDPDYGVPAPLEILAAILPEQHRSLFAEVEDEGTHAALVRELADATRGAWQVDDVLSRKDEENGACQVSVKERGHWTHWRFAEYGHALSCNFLRHLLDHGGRRADGKFLVCNQEDEFVDVLFLPAAALSALDQASLPLTERE